MMMKCDQDKTKYDKDNDENDQKDEDEGEPGKWKGKCSTIKGYGRERDKGERGASWGDRLGKVQNFKKIIKWNMF